MGFLMRSVESKLIVSGNLSKEIQFTYESEVLEEVIPVTYDYVHTYIPRLDDWTSNQLTKLYQINIF